MQASRSALAPCGLFGGVASGADAVWDADAAIGIPRQRKAGQLLPQSFDSIETVKMSHAVLRHS